MRNQVFNRFVFSIFIFSMIIIITISTLITFNNFDFNISYIISCFDIIGKISTPITAIFIAIYFSTTTENYQKMSIAKSIISEISKERLELNDIRNDIKESVDRIFQAKPGHQ